MTFQALASRHSVGRGAGTAQVRPSSRVMVQNHTVALRLPPARLEGSHKEDFSTERVIIFNYIKIVH